MSWTRVIMCCETASNSSDHSPTLSIGRLYRRWKDLSWPRPVISMRRSRGLREASDERAGCWAPEHTTRSVRGLQPPEYTLFPRVTTGVLSSQGAVVPFMHRQRAWVGFALFVTGRPLIHCISPAVCHSIHYNVQSCWIDYQVLRSPAGL